MSCFDTFDSILIFTITDILTLQFILDKTEIELEERTQLLDNDDIDKEQLRNFLKEGHLTICHARCIIVGCAGAGKTTLLRRLEGATLKELKDIKETELLDVHVNDFEVVKEKKTIKRNVYFQYLQKLW